jgi:hypothetical protein
MDDLSLIGLSWYISITFGVALLINLCQFAVFRRQQALRTSRAPIKASHVPTGRVRIAQIAFYVNILLTTSSMFVYYALSLYAQLRDFDSAALWDGGYCFGGLNWVIAMVFGVAGYFTEPLTIILLDFIYAATLNEIGLTGRSHRIAFERKCRGFFRNATVLFLLFSSLSIYYDALAVLLAAPDLLRSNGCMALTREATLSSFSVRVYGLAMTMTWIYLSISLLLLLARNATAAREAHKHRLPTYELYRSALSRIRVIIYSNLFALGAVTAALRIVGPLETNLIQAPVNLSKACQYTVSLLYFLINGFAFLHKPSQASPKSTTITSPMMAAMEASFSPTAPATASPPAML